MRRATRRQENQGQSGMFSSIHSACCFTLLSILPTSKIEMEIYSTERIFVAGDQNPCLLYAEAIK